MCTFNGSFHEMKKILVIFLLSSYSLSIMGASVSIHECGGHKSYTFFNISVGEKCFCDHNGSNHKSSCCKNHTVEVKAKKSECQVSSLIFSKTPITNTVLTPSFIFFSNCLPSKSLNSFVLEHPPNLYAPPLYIQYEQYLI